MKNEFPIMAYIGVHNNPNNEENYKRFKECGFNLSMWQFGDYENDKGTGFREACDMAAKYGIGIIACCDDIYAKPAETAKKMKEISNLYGYYIVDEPSVQKMVDFQKKYVEPILSSDTTHTIYMNLLPHYDDNMQEAWGCKTYKEYLEGSKVMDYTYISFDFYPVTKDGLRKNAWYNNLQEILDFSKETGKEWWGFILSVPHHVYPQPEMSHLRIQAYTNLAYGAQGLEYFTYQTPYDDSYDFHNGPIEKDSVTVTVTWYLVKAMNDELKNVLPIFHHATDFNVVKSKRILCCSKIKRRDLPEGFSKIKVNNKDGIIVSTFKKGVLEYVMIVNSSYEKDVKLTVSQDGYNHVNKTTLALEDTQSKYTLRAGDCEIFIK